MTSVRKRERGKERGREQSKWFGHLIMVALIRQFSKYVFRTMQKNRCLFAKYGLLLNARLLWNPIFRPIPCFTFLSPAPAKYEEAV